jgi:hypothetical protein
VAGDEILRRYPDGTLAERSRVDPRGALAERTWFIEPGQPFIELLNREVLMDLGRHPISYRCFNGRGERLDDRGFPAEGAALDALKTRSAAPSYR